MNAILPFSALTPLARLCRLSAFLLTYPDKACGEKLGKISDILKTSGLMRETESAFCALIECLQKKPSLERESNYVGLFDMSPSLSLYLFEHVHGDSRLRGQAMVQLLEEYRAAGFDLSAEETPDFIPVFLEYASTRKDSDIKQLLGETVEIFSLLQKRLEGRKSTYAKIFEILVLAAGRAPDSEKVEVRLAETEKLDDPALMDENYVEKPVNFMKPDCGNAGDEKMQCNLRPAVNNPKD